MARRESGAGQQMELVAAAPVRAGGENTTTDGAPQPHPLFQSKPILFCIHLIEGQLT